jgi:NCAIR mutase (PurE)-related protein
MYQDTIKSDEGIRFRIDGFCQNRSGKPEKVISLGRTPEEAKAKLERFCEVHKLTLVEAHFWHQDYRQKEVSKPTYER